MDGWIYRADDGSIVKILDREITLKDIVEYKTSIEDIQILLSFSFTQTKHGEYPGLLVRIYSNTLNCKEFCGYYGGEGTKETGVCLFNVYSYINVHNFLSSKIDKFVNNQPKTQTEVEVELPFSIKDNGKEFIRRMMNHSGELERTERQILLELIEVVSRVLNHY